MAMIPNKTSLLSIFKYLLAPKALTTNKVIIVFRKMNQTNYRITRPYYFRVNQIFSLHYTAFLPRHFDSKRTKPDSDSH